jgi:hypothetical protein
MSRALLPGPISRSSGSLQYDPAPTCLFSSLWRHSCEASLQPLRPYRPDFAYSPACPDTLPAAISRWSPRLPCLIFHILKMVPRI